jgi:hypothetical protein
VSEVLAIGAVVVLTGLALLSFMRQREGVAAEKERANARAHTGDAQHERSSSRRAAVRLEQAKNAGEVPRVDEEPSAAPPRP